MSIVKLGAALAAACVMITALPAAASASEITDAFLANVRPNVAFLDQSSRIAALRAGSELARVYARGEAAVTTEVAANDETVVTGRSAARDGLGQAANGRAALGPKDVLELGALSGKAFDDLYWEKQLDALSQLAADYRAYAAGGDNPALVAMAKRELPRVEDRLKALSAI